MRNQAQPYLRVMLPERATLLSAEVAGGPVKPATGENGMRIPLLRPGFRPSGPYSVSFVYVHSGVAFAKRGDGQAELPRLDMPVGVLEWELFLPDGIAVRRFGGTAAAADAWMAPTDREAAVEGGVSGGVPGGVVGSLDWGRAQVGGGSATIVGVVMDQAGNALPGATVTLSRDGWSTTTTADGLGRYTFEGVPSGSFHVGAQLSGFASSHRPFASDGRQTRRVDFRLKVGALEETVTVTAEAPLVDTNRAGWATTIRADAEPPPAAKASGLRNAPSSNVASLQKRAAGVLPVRVDVPRTGVSYRFVRPLVLDEFTTATFAYKRR